MPPVRTQLLAVFVGVVVVTIVNAPLRAADAPAAQPAAATQGPIVAQVGNASVTLDQLQRPLLKGYGLNILLNLVQLEVAKENAAKAGVAVTPDDVSKETKLTVDRMFEQSNEKMMDKVKDARAKGDEPKARRSSSRSRRTTRRRSSSSCRTSTSPARSSTSSPRQTPTCARSPSRCSLGRSPIRRWRRRSSRCTARR
jgi:hypothetical protein